MPPTEPPTVEARAERDRCLALFGRVIGKDNKADLVRAFKAMRDGITLEELVVTLDNRNTSG